MEVVQKVTQSSSILHITLVTNHLQVKITEAPVVKLLKRNVTDPTRWIGD